MCWPWPWPWHGARVVNKLETVDMEDTRLTNQQMTRILTQGLISTNLRKLSIRGNGKVDEELYIQAKQVIQNLDKFGKQPNLI